MPKLKQEKKEMEYEDAPSGYCTLYDYKSPFMAYEGGYGFQGVLLFDGKTDKIQCHLCGAWEKSLQHHLKREHALNVSTYKDRVGLSQTTALISESTREKLIAHNIGKRIQNLQNRKGKSHSTETREKIRETLKKNSMELKNKRGTCPLQLLTRLKAVYEKVGEEDFTTDCVPFYEALIKTYGTFAEACRRAGVPCKARNVPPSRMKYTKESIVEWVREFINQNGRAPKEKDFLANNKRRIYQAISRRFGIQEIIKEARALATTKIDGDHANRYTDEELLQNMRDFERVNGREPYPSDARRGFTSDVQTFVNHFGSWKKAKELAFTK
jgi:alkylated DNA nucleotide flippase Atl1